MHSKDVSLDGVGNTVAGRVQKHCDERAACASNVMSQRRLLDIVGYRGKLGFFGQERDPRLLRRPEPDASPLAALLSIALALPGLTRAPCQRRASAPGPSPSSPGSGSYQARRSVASATASPDFSPRSVARWGRFVRWREISTEGSGGVAEATSSTRRERSRVGVRRCAAAVGAW